jgi:hypothetical protein
VHGVHSRQMLILFIFSVGTPQMLCVDREEAIRFEDLYRYP